MSKLNFLSIPFLHKFPLLKFSILLTLLLTLTLPVVGQSSSSRCAGLDFNTLIADGNSFPRGIWSDGTTVWVADYSYRWWWVFVPSPLKPRAQRKIYAYNLSSKARDASKDFNTLHVAGNTSPQGLWSDGTTIWVSNLDDNKIYAYNLASKVRDYSKDFNTLDAENTYTGGLWSDGTTIWVSNLDDNKIHAYNLESKARDASKDFNTLYAAGNTSPEGLWSDGITMWVVDSFDDKLYAYNLASKARDASKDFNTLYAARNNHPRGLWSDRTTMWVVDLVDRKLYAYTAASNCPPSVPEVLRATAQTGTTITIGWTQVADLTYEVSNNNGTDYINVGATNRHTFTKLSPATEYRIKIKTSNAAGSGESATITVRTPYLSSDK